MQQFSQGVESLSAGMAAALPNASLDREDCGKDFAFASKILGERVESILVPGKTRALRHMMLNHIHFQVRDLKAAIAWFQRILQLQPGFHNERIAVFSFGAFTVILDAASVDAPATLGFQAMIAIATFGPWLSGERWRSTRPATRSGA